jgi:hypothetical protein
MLLNDDVSSAEVILSLRMIIYGEAEGMLKEVIMANFKILSPQHLPVWNEKNHTKSQS